jgi:hypothetical protein
MLGTPAFEGLGHQGAVMKYLSALTSISCAILLAVIAIALSFQMRNKADTFGADVSGRFLETGGSYERGPPPRAAEPRRGAPARETAPVVKTNDTEAAALRRWVTANTGNAARPGAALNYANPILIQYDIAFLLALGLFLMIATVRMASAHVIEWLGLVPPRLFWIFAVLPAVYIVADLAEDILLWRFLTDQASISPLLVGFAKNLTALKLYSLIGAMAVAAAVALAGMAHALANARKR